MAAAVILLEAMSLIGVAYLVLAGIAVRRFAARPTPQGPTSEPVTILKPLHGEDAELYENLRSFCVQSYATYQVIFGVRDANDAAIPIVRRLIGEFPDTDLTLVIDPRVAGTNFKVSNLENMLAKAKHEILVIADSDMHVRPDYLTAVTASLTGPDIDRAGPDIGLVTCLYRGRPIAGLWSQLGAMFVNYGFLPSAIVGQWAQPGEACFGATMALRRSVCDEIGGFAPLRDQLADDYALGAAVRRLGKTIVLSPLLVDTVIAEPSLGALLRHELRWARTIRLIAPLGYAASIITHPVALAACGAALSLFSGPALAVLVAALIFRLITVRMIDRALRLPASPPWLVPFRDMLSFAVFIVSFLGNSIAWRDQSFRLAGDGRLVTNGDTRA
jgi:ceramide glucosyltransferase